MGVPETHNAVTSQSSQLPRKGTIASRYLEAIGMQCGTDSNVSSSRNSYRSTPIEKRGGGSGFDDEYYSFKDKNKNRDVWSRSVYDKISGTTKAADCSKSIITASTALMIDHSDSLSTTPTSPGGSGHGKSPGRRTLRRGRSPTAFREGTNSRSNNRSNNRHAMDYQDDSSHEYVHTPGSRTTAPLSDGVKSAPSTPTRFDERRKLQQFRPKSWSDRNTALAGNSGGYIARMNQKSIMGINSSTSESEAGSETSSKPDSRLGLTFYKNSNHMNQTPSPLYNTNHIHGTPSPLSSEESSHSSRLFPKTSPRRPSDSPGPQPISPRQYTYHQPITPDSSQNKRTVDIFDRSGNNSHPHYPTDSEAGSPTEIMENTRRDDGSSPPSSHYQSEPTDSEAGAPTEIMKNHRIDHRPYHLRRPSGGDDGNQINSQDRRNNDILSRVRSRFHNQVQKQQPKPQQIEQEKPSMPSLLDANSSCEGSSALPMVAAQAEGASASVIPPGRLSRHVENARKQSIWSPEPSEATSQPASLDNETFGSTSLTTEIGSSRLGAKPLADLQSLQKPVVAKPEAPKQGGLLRRPINARVAALESQYRKGKLTARGARINKQEPVVEKQEIVQQQESEEEDFPDPIISASYSLDDIKQRKEQADKEIVDSFKDSDEESVKKSDTSPDDKRYEYDFEESPLPAYARNQATGEGSDRSSAFVAYNYRQTPNTDGVFQLKKGKGKGKAKSNQGKQASAHRKDIESRGRDRGKSPIQPLFSSERLDENNTIRSKSAGRTTPSQRFTKIADRNSNGFEDIKGLPRRSKSLSERSERKHPNDPQNMTFMEISEAMKTIMKDRKRREQDQKKQQASRKSVPDNIVVNNETSKTVGSVGAPRSDSSLTQSTIPSPPSHPGKSFNPNKYSPPSARQAEAESPRKQEMSQKELTNSIKDKIRAFNLKKSPQTYNSTKKFPDEKKEDGYAVERFNGDKKTSSPTTQTKKLDRKPLWARYYAESLKNRNEDESESTNDDFSVESLKEQLEKRISKSQNNFADGDKDDDDMSVKNLRDMFEPATKKQTGEAVNNLKARFEQKPKTPRLSFTKQARLQKNRSKREVDGDKFPKVPYRSEWDSTEPEVKEMGEKAGDIQEDPLSFNWWKLQEQESPESDDSQDLQKDLIPKHAHNRWNAGPTRLQKEKKSIRIDPVEQRSNINGSNIPSQHQVFGLIETRQAPLKDNNKVPGSHWVSQRVGSDDEQIIQKKGTKESSSGSEYSEAVTLDPSLADVSNLSNPSALQSPETEQDESESSVLFENLNNIAPYGELGHSNSDLAIPELKESRREANNARVVSGSSIRKYKNLNSQSMAQNRVCVEAERIQRDIKEESPRIVTPDHASEIKTQFFERSEDTGVSHGGYAASAAHNGIIHNTQRDVNRSGRPDRNTESFGYSGMENYRRGANSSDRSTRSSEAPSSNRSARSLGNSHQDNAYWGANSSDRSSRSSEGPPSSRSGRSLDNSHRENSYRGGNSSDRSNRSSEAPSSYRSGRSLDNHNHDYDYDVSNRSRGLQESPGEIRPMVIPHRDRALSNRSSQSSGSQRSRTSDDESRDQSNIHKHKLLSGSSQPSPKPPVVPPIPSPFDEDYAAIMESRHKMLVVRQRTLLNRRANREKMQRTQQGFFGRTNPGNNDDSTSLLNRAHRDPRPSDEFSNRIRRDPRPSDEFTDVGATKSPQIRMASNPNSGWKTPVKSPREQQRELRPSSRDSPNMQRAKDIVNAAGVPRSPAASMLSRIKPTFNAFSRKDSGTSQKQAVIDRISAVRAARLRRSYAYGKVESSVNNSSYGEVGTPKRKHTIPRKLETINDAVAHDIPGYRYYPHNEFAEFRTADGDESLSTRESNPQDFAAEFSLD